MEIFQKFWLLHPISAKIPLKMSFNEVIMKILADENIPYVRECFSSIGDVMTISGRKIAADAIKDTDALLVRSITKVDETLLTGSSVKFVATATIGTEHIDLDYLAQNNIGFASAPGSNANSVAEYIVSALLNLADKYDFDIADKSIGIIGVGNVGSKVEQKTKVMGMDVFLNDPPLERQAHDPKYLPRTDLFDCDIITLHTPLTFQGIDKTYHLADEKFFDSLKDSAIFINSSRGGVTDTKALKKALMSGKLKAVVLDVWEGEPNIDIELVKMVDFATPHIAGYSYDGKVAGMIMIYNSLCEHFKLEAKNTIDNFLPEPQVGEIKIDGTGKNILLETVNRLYDIRNDDAKLRSIANEPVEGQGRFFDGLRKNYHIRREFQNTEIVLSESLISIGKILSGIGFKVN